MLISIVGCGAMASLYGAYLHQLSDLQLVLWGNWQEQISTVKQHGLILKSTQPESAIDLDMRFTTEQALHSDLVLFLVKSYQTRQAAVWAKDHLSTDAIALTLQNGIGNHEMIAECFGQGQSFAGTTDNAAHLVEPGVLKVASIGKTLIGYRKNQRHQAESLSRLFQRAGLPCKISPGPETVLWEKLIVNVAINPLTAIFDIPNGNLVKISRLNQLKNKIVEEVLAAAEKIGIPLTDHDMIKKTDDICRATAENYSSMLQDIRHQRPTEIEAICGRMLRMAHNAGQDMPICRWLHDSVTALQSRTTTTEQILDSPEWQQLLERL